MAVAFPFERDRPYRLGDLRSFEDKLRSLRFSDPVFSDELRVPSDPRGWMALRLKELIPLRLYADHAGFSDTDTFKIMPDGAPIDAELSGADKRRLLQITLAAPMFRLAGGKDQSSGYQHYQIMRALNESEIVSGYPPYDIQDGIAVGTIQTLTNDQRDNACKDGLAEALKNKARFDGRGVTLAVLARDFYMQLSDSKLFAHLVKEVIQGIPTSFHSVAVFDSHPGFFIEVPGNSDVRSPENQELPG